MKTTVSAIFIVGFFCLITLNACSDTIFSSGNSQTVINGLKFDITDETFTVTNETNQSAYYFTVERSLLPSILWLPVSTDENRVKPGQKITYSFDEMLCCSQDGEISFFHWYGVYSADDHPSDYETIPQTVIDPKTKKARKL